jgi:diguanylate cyclase (GGDEF)-like protein/PAS domain S-box-containing protein
MTHKSEEASAESLSSSWIVGIAIIVALSGLLLTALYWRAEVVSPQVHQNYTLLLRELREADAEIDAEVLASRLELTRNYDALTAELARAIRVGEQVGAVPDFLDADDQTTLRAGVGDLRTLLAEKARLIEIFKRSNAVLRNSLAYFPNAADDLARLRPASELAREVEHYARQVLSYARLPDPERASELGKAAFRLEVMTVSVQERAGIDNVLRHGRMIVATLSEVDRVSRKALGLPTSQQVETLNRDYAAAYERAARTAGRYRALLYALSLLLTAYLAYTFVHLDRARRSLAKVYQELRERHAAQLLAEERLRLHATAFNNAHEGMTLTDAEGAILEVNPAFTRITGYERSEVIGRNPRVLKSGRHDREFYEAMWKSIIETGTWRGEIWNRGKFGDIYPELLSISAVHDEAKEVTNYVAVFADITRIKEQEKQLTHMAYFDALTELPNRVLLADRIVQASAQARRSRTLMAVCYMDLDGFKSVNDTWGHEVGDQLLVEMAARLKGFVRGGDTVARLGGDEFVLLLVGMASSEECERAAQRMLQVIGQPLLVAPKPVSLSASVGVTIFPTDDGDADTLVRHADQAMYRAKQSGKNRFLIFDPDQDRYTRSRFDRVARIQDGLDQREFVLHYQPIVDMRCGQVAGVEALIRWQHPERGLLAPVEFLPLIEDHDLSIRLGDWVIETALRQLEAWRAAGLDITVSVNLAARQLQSPDFVQTLSEALERHPEVATRLELEVVETAALEDVVRVSRVITECRRFGVSFALDDFGTGYSSLTYLKRLPVSTIKIDQSFVRDILSDPNNLVIVQGVLGLAGAFQRRVVAEGVETAEHGRLLLQLGCDIAQGFGIAKPMVAESLVEWAGRWQPDPQWQEVAGLRWDVADYPMMVAEVDIRNWVTQVVYSVREAQPVPHRYIEDARHCRFGQWYFGPDARRYADFGVWQDVAGHHEQIHVIAGEIDRRMRDGRLEHARALVGDLLAQQDELLAALRVLQFEVATAR